MSAILFFQNSGSKKQDHNYYDVLPLDELPTEMVEELTVETATRDRRAMHHQKNAAMQNETFRRDFKDWHESNDSDKESLHEFLRGYPEYFPYDRSLGLVKVRDCDFKKLGLREPVDAVHIDFDAMSAASLPQKTYFEECYVKALTHHSSLSLQGYTVFNSIFVGDFNNAQWINCEIKATDFRRANLKDNYFKNSTIVGCDFAEADLSYCSLEQMTIDACRFSNSDLTKVVAHLNTTITGSNFQEANMQSFRLGSEPLTKNIQDISTIDNCDFTGVDLSSAATSCDAVWQGSLFDPVIARGVLETYQGYFPPDANCTQTYLSSANCQDLYEQRANEMDIDCPQMIPAGACDANMHGFKTGAGERQATGLVVVPNSGRNNVAPSIVYGQSNKKAVRSALYNEGAQNTHEIGSKYCTVRGNPDSDIPLIVLSVMGGLVASGILLIIACWMYTTCKRSNSSETAPLLPRDAAPRDAAPRPGR